ncbi:MAG: hypothetical protein U1F37_20260 [Alphaproteobacteria bacterium]
MRPLEAAAEDEDAAAPVGGDAGDLLHSLAAHAAVTREAIDDEIFGRAAIGEQGEAVAIGRELEAAGVLVRFDVRRRAADDAAVASHGQQQRAADRGIALAALLVDRQERGAVGVEGQRGGESKLEARVRLHRHGPSQRRLGLLRVGKAGEGGEQRESARESPGAARAYRSATMKMRRNGNSVLPSGCGGYAAAMRSA